MADCAGIIAAGPLVLIVEDDQQIQEVVRLVLEDESIASVAARSGREALLQIEQHHPAVMLLDLGLPDSDTDSPASVAEAAKAAGVLIVICSAAGRNVEDLAQRIEADAYLVKPFDIEDLIATVRRLLG